MTDPHIPAHRSAGDEPVLRAALIAARGHVPFELVDWDRFHARLRERGELPLARLRYPHVARRSTRHLTDAEWERTAPTPPPAWWEYTARWSRLIIASSVAAGIALVAVVRTSPKEPAESVIASVIASDEAADRTRAAFESAAVGGTAAWTIDQALVPSAADLLIPLGGRTSSP